VMRVDPEAMLVGVDALAAVALEGLAAVAGAVEIHAQDIEVLVVARVDAHLAEVHRPRVETVHARPRLAAVGGLVEATVLVTVRPLLVLHVGLLATVHKAPGALATSAAATSAARRRFQHQVQLQGLRLALAPDGESDPVPVLAPAQELDHPSAAGDRLAV